MALLIKPTSHVNININLKINLKNQRGRDTYKLISQSCFQPDIEIRQEKCQKRKLLFNKPHKHRWKNPKQSTREN